MSQRPLKIALAGNPNTGKSSLFNALTGMRQKVGNFPGVTVDRKSASLTLPGGTKAQLVDLPGLYSIYPQAEDDRISSEVLRLPSHADHPDRIIVVADATNLRRTLLLATQLIDLGLPLVVAVNMVDLLGKEGMALDTDRLAKDLGVPVVRISALRRTGLRDLLLTVENATTPPARPFFRVPESMRPVAENLRKALGLHTAYQGFQALLRPDLHPHNDPDLITGHQAQAGITDPLALQANEITVRFDALDSLLEHSLRREATPRDRFTQRLDRWLLHPVLGYVIFISVLLLMFQAIFAWAAIPMDLIDAGFSAAGSWMKETFPPGVATDLLVEGVWAGISGIVVFIPQICILFLFIAILEDTGYMSRAVFLMDRLMRPFGFSGASVIPLIGGMACAVPSIMMARSIPQRRDRLITILVTPLMSCSARIPVYVLLIGLFVPDARWGPFNLQGLVMAGMYLLGFLMALLVAWVMKTFMREGGKGRVTHFLTELPLYRSPRWKNVGMVMLNKARTFVWEAGRVILVLSIVLWVLGSYGPPAKMEDLHLRYDARIEAAQGEEKAALQNEYNSLHLEASYVGHIGKAMEPAIRPLGFDWKIGISIVTSFAAREVFVGTMATLYSAGEDAAADESGKFAQLRSRMAAEVRPGTGEKVYTPVVALSLLVFYAFAMQCMSTLAVTRKETGSWKMTFLMLVYLTGLAYVSSLLIYQVWG